MTEVDLACQELIVYQYLYLFTSTFSKTRTGSKQHSYKCTAHLKVIQHSYFTITDSARFASCRQLI